MGAMQPLPEYPLAQISVYLGNSVPPQLRQSDLAADIPQYSLVLERLRRGDVCDLVVDTETSDLSKYFAHPSALGAVLADPFTRSIVHTHERQVRFDSRIATFDVIAGLVTERSPETFDKGMRPDLAMAEFYDLIRHAARYIATAYAGIPDRIRAHNTIEGNEKIPLPPEGDDAIVHYKYVTNRRTQVERELRIKEPKQTREARDVVFIPMRDTNGDVIYHAGISRDGRFVYWRENDGVWHRTEAKKTVIMHNQRADNNWLWEWCHRYLLPDQFITHTKKYRAFMIDTIPLAREVALMGPQGRNRLKLGTRNDPTLGPVASTSLDSIMQANRRIANTRIAINDGVRIAGGAQADPRMGHVSPAYDGLKTLGLYWYCQDIAPELVAEKKRFSDHDLFGETLMEALPDGSPRPFAFVRSRYPYLDTHAGVAINLDKSYGDFKKAVVISVDLLREDPADPQALLLPDGRNIFELDHDSWMDLFRKTYTDRFSVLEVISLNKSAMVHTLEHGLANEALRGITPQLLNRRAQMLTRDPDLRARIMESYAKTRTPYQAPEKVHDPRPEEYVFAGTGDPQRIQIQRANRDERDEIERAVFERAKSKMDFYSKRNHYLRILMRPYPEIEQKGGNPEAYRDYERHLKKTLGKYERLMRGTMLSQRVRTDAPHINVPKYKRARFHSNKDVQKFLWSLRRKALKKGWLVDVSSGHYRIVDESTGREISLTRLGEIDMHRFRDAMDPTNGTWDIQFEQLNYQQHFLAHMFVLAGRKNELFDIDPEWKLWYKAQKAFGHNGSPLVDANAQRMPTAARNLQIINRVRNGTLDAASDMKLFSSDPDQAAGLRARFIEALPGREEILASFERLARGQLRSSAWTPETLEYAGYDPLSRRRQENILYPIARKAFDAAIKLDMPDAAIEKPMRSDISGEMIYPVPFNETMRAAWEAGRLSGLANAVFRTRGMGRTFLLPKARFMPTTLEKGTPHYHLVRQIFQDSAMEIEPDQTPVMMVSSEGHIPVAGVKVVEPHFALQVPGQNRFKALLAPEIAGYQDKNGTYERRLGGLVIPDYGYEEAHGYNVVPGATVRLREMSEPRDNRKSVETGWEIPVELKEVTHMTLAAFEESYARHEITPEVARRYGFAGPEAMYTEICQWFTAYDKPTDSDQNKIMLIRFERPKRKQGTEFFLPSIVPRAAILDTYRRSLNNHAIR